MAKNNQDQVDTFEDEDTPQKPTSTPEHLKADAQQATGGIASVVTGTKDIALGSAKGLCHTYESMFNPKARRTLAVFSIVAMIGYGAAQKELGAPSLGDIYSKAKSVASSGIEAGNDLLAQINENTPTLTASSDENGGYSKQDRKAVDKIFAEVQNTPTEQ